MSIFGPKAGRQIGRLAFDAMSIARGEQITRRPISQPHHAECPVCHFDRWDGSSEHRWGGGRFAQRLCYGPAKDKIEQRAPGQPTHALLEELVGLASDVGEDLGAEPAVEVSRNPRDSFEILGDARKP